VQVERHSQAQTVVAHPDHHVHAAKRRWAPSSCKFSSIPSIQAYTDTATFACTDYSALQSEYERLLRRHEAQAVTDSRPRWTHRHRHPVMRNMQVLARNHQLFDSF